MRELLHDAALIFGRCAREARRNAPVTFIAPAVIAIFVAVVFDAIYGQIAAVDGFPTDEFLAWLAPGVVLLSVFVAGGVTAGAAIRDVRSGYLDRLRLLPMRPGALLLGRAAFDAVRVLPPAAAVFAVALALGADNAAGVRGWLAVLALAAALGVAWNGLFHFVALRTASAASLQGVQPLFMPATMFSTFWVPTAFMPGWYEVIATANPFSQLFDALRSVLLGDTDWAALAIALATLAALGAVTYALAARELHRLTNN